MTSSTPDAARLEAVSIDLTIAEAQIRALLAVQAKRSPTAFGDMLQALGHEAEVLSAAAVGAQAADSTRLNAASAGLNSVVESLKEMAFVA